MDKELKEKRLEEIEHLFLMIDEPDRISGTPRERMTLRLTAWLIRAIYETAGDDTESTLTARRAALEVNQMLRESGPPSLTTQSKK